MVKDILQQIQKEIEVWLTEQGVHLPVVAIEEIAESKFGDFSTNIAMRYAKELKKSPVDIATNLSEHMRSKNFDYLESVSWAAPGFVNFHLSSKAKVEHLLGILSLSNDFGKNQSHKGQNWVIEHSSPNPNKAMHIGHMRNSLVGMSLVRLLKSSGAGVTSDIVYNNRGISIAKNMYGYLAHMKKEGNSPTDIKYWAEHQEDWFLPEDKEQRPDLFVTECYVLGEQDFSGDPETEKIIREMVVDWEAGDEATWKLWELVLNFAYEGIGRTLARLGSETDNIWFEHEHYQKGKDYVNEGLEKGLFQKLEDGAVLTNLEKDYKLSDTVLLKKDGTSLYITQDIALTDLKKKKYDADKLVWVVGPEQTLAFRQMFAVCEQLGIGKVEDFTHIAYGNVGLKDKTGASKKMSSREGMVVFADDMVDTVKATIRKRFDEDDRNDESVREELSEKLALAAVKFAFLKSDSNQDLSFDIGQSVDVHGDSGMYVMYSFVRTQSILRKGGQDFSLEAVSAPAKLGTEAELVRTLLYFEDVVMKSVSDLSVHHVSQYLLELSSQFNSWYAKETILDGGPDQAYKLAVVKAVATTMVNGLNLLGIETVDEM
jgi:arginyl-tRNA synthetase